MHPQAGALVNAAEPDGTTALHILAASSHAEAATAISAILRAGAKVDAARDDGLTPLYAAAYEGHAHVAALLIEAGCCCSRVVVVVVVVMLSLKRRGPGADVNGAATQKTNSEASHCRGGYMHLATPPLSYTGMRQVDSHMKDH